MTSAALERDVIALGVSEKQKGRARQVFERSAELAGYFEHGKNRLVMPAVVTSRDQPREESKTDQENGGGNGSDGKPPEIDPIIRGLVRLPRSGDVWPEQERKLWLGLLEGSFKLIYKDKDQSTGWTSSPKDEAAK
jgi:hypothetical protein